MTTALLPAATVARHVGFSRQSIYRMVAAGKFPAPIKLETGAIRWLDNEIQEWIERQAQGPRAAYKQEPRRPAKPS